MDRRLAFALLLLASPAWGQGNISLIEAAAAACPGGIDLSADADLAGWWRLEEGAGARVDSSAAGNDLTVAGTITQNLVSFVEGVASNETAGGSGNHLSRVNGSLSAGFCGKSDSVEDDCSWGGWVRFDSIAATSTMMTTANNVVLRLAASSIQCFIRQDDAAVRAILSDSAVTAGVWTHAVCNWDGTDLKMWVDGVEQAASTTANSIQGGTSNFRMFCNASNSLCMNGGIDESFVFTRDLTQAEIDSIHDCGVDGGGLP